MVEGNGRHEMVKDVGFDNTMHDLPADEAELSVDGCSGTASEVPDIVFIVRKLGISVL